MFVLVLRKLYQLKSGEDNIDNIVNVYLIRVAGRVFLAIGDRISNLELREVEGHVVGLD